MPEKRSRSRSSTSGRRWSDHSHHTHHSHRSRDSGNHSSFRHQRSNSVESSHERREYHGDRHHRYAATSRKYHTVSRSDQHSLRRSSSQEVERDDSIGHFMGKKGDIVHSHYEIVRELGTGTFAKAFEIIDLDSGTHYAMKVVRALHRYTKSARIEAKILRDITEHDPTYTSHCYHLHSEFLWHDHFCMVVDLLGASLYETLQRNDYRPFPLAAIRPILFQVLQGLAFLHAQHLTHTDLKLENLLFRTPQSMQNVLNMQSVQNDQGQSVMLPWDPQHPHHLPIAIVDFGSATYASECRKGTINTRQYRAPEVLLHLPWDEASDIWGVACIAMELFTGDLLFQTHDDLLHFALIEKIVGPIPRDMMHHLSDRKRRYFDEEGHVKLHRLHRSEQSHVERTLSLQKQIGEKTPCLYDLLRRCLAIDPRQRISAQEALEHEFFRDMEK